SRVLRRRVVVAVNLRVLEVLIVVEAAEELELVDVLVLLAALVLAGLLWAGRDADGVGDVQLLFEPARDRALANAGRADEDDQQSAIFGFARHVVVIPRSEPVPSAGRSIP